MAEPAQHDRSPATVFCFLWAAAELFDLVCFPDWITSPAGIALFFASLAVLVKPSAHRRFLLLCLCDLAYLWVKSPWTPNHFLFKGLVCLTILVVASRAWFRPQVAIFAEAAALLRLELLALYFFSFLHKLNGDFLQPSISCAAFMLDGVAERLPFLPTGDWAATPAIWSTLLIEGGIPLLLLFPRTRWAALLAAWFFHLLLSFHPRPGIYAFSAMMYALLSLFAPVQAVRSPWAWDVLHSVSSALERHRRALWTAIPVLVVGLALALFLSGVNLHGTNISEWPRMLGMLVWIPYSLLIFAALWSSWPPAAPPPAQFGLAMRSPAAAVLALILLNGMAPYLGFQTVRVLSMFSNLQTEGGRTNHLFIPISWQLADYQRDLVEIVSSSEPVLQFYAGARQFIPFAEVRRRMWEPRVTPSVTFIRNGQRVSLAAGSPQAATVVPPLGTLASKILAFRGINMDGTAECLW